MHDLAHSVETVSAEIGDRASGVIPEPTESAQEAGAIERDFRRGAEIEIPIETFGRGRIGRAADAVRSQVAIIPDAHETHLTEFATLDDALDLAVMRGRPVLRAGLHDAFVFSRGGDHCAAFTDVVGEWLFDVNVLARLAREQGRDGVPVIGRGDVN